MTYAVGLMEYSDDPLSDATPSYDDISAYVVGGVSWSDGRSRDLDDPQAGSISFRLRNQNGEWFPNSGDSLYPDSPFLLRRLRWSVNGTAEGIWYVTRWQPTYPAGTSYSEIDVTAVDGFELLSLDNLDLLDPPTATSVEEVITSLAPFAYYPLDDKVGTVARAAVGPECVYKNTPALGELGLAVGDGGTAVIFDSDEGAEASLAGTEHFSDRNSFTMGALVEMQEALSANIGIISVLGGSAVIASLGTSAGTYIALTDAPGGNSPISSTVPTSGVKNTVITTFDSGKFRIYIDGVLEDEVSKGTLLPTGANPVLRIGNYGSGTGDRVKLQHVFALEHPLSADLVAALSDAMLSRGFDEQTAGERVAAVADSTLWAETEIQAGEHTVHPVMEHGQSKLEEIRAAVKAEMPDNHFFFDGDGNPTYLAWNYKDGAGPLATFGPGGIGYESIEPVYDDEMFTEVTVGHEAAPGEETQHTVTDTAAESEFYRRAHAETGLILTDHQDAIAVATALLERFRGPQQRYASLTINGTDTSARTQILSRQIGDMIRVKGIGVNDSDIVTTILGKSKTLTAAGHLTCTWTLSRGFDAAAGEWQLGIDGFSELNQTTVLA